MILLSLKNSTRIQALHPRFKKAFDFIQNNDLSQMEPGKVEIDGDALYVSIMETEGKQRSEAKLEAHQKYIDIQVIINGVETMGWSALENGLCEISPYLPEKDIVFFSNEPTTYFSVHPGACAVFFPEDGHAPSIGEGLIKKAVIKVLV